VALVVDSLAGETILLVEDDPAGLDYVTEVLNDLNYTVVQARSAEDALKRLRDTPAPLHLLLTDVVMPSVAGRVLAKNSRRVWPALRVLFMTGYSRNAIVRRGRFVPGVQLVRKPLA
jgi:CheY-like chemotaxis protein